MVVTEPPAFRTNNTDGGTPTPKPHSTGTDLSKRDDEYHEVCSQRIIS